MLLFRLLKSFSRRELGVFVCFLLFFSVSLVLLSADIIAENTKIVPVYGGEYVEGAVGQPVFINPVLANGNIDRSLTELIFGDLEELAESYKYEDSGKIWRYRLKENIFWHDSKPITSDDVIFSIKTVQNPDVYSPLFKNWQGVSVKRVSEREVEFGLPAPYVFFESVFKSFKPIPKHIFGDIPAANIKLSNYNLNPVGSGKYKFSSFKKRSDGFINYYGLNANNDYFGKAPYIKKFTFVFYQNGSEIINDFNFGKIDGFLAASKDDLSRVILPHQIFKFPAIKYYAVFFNPYSHPALNDGNVRLALNKAVDKEEIIEAIFNKHASKVFGPLVAGAEGFNEGIYPNDDFSAGEAEQILERTGWVFDGDEMTRGKKNNDGVVKLEFVLAVPDIPFLIETADKIKDYWARIGVKLDVSVFPLDEINNGVIKDRNYQMILFGNVLGENPDLFSFWHSSERFYPGFNLALYENKSVDKLIESIRKNFDKEKRKSDLTSLQSLIVGDRPAIFLYSPDYLYVANKNLGGVESGAISLPNDIFSSVENWHVKTARALK